MTPRTRTAAIAVMATASSAVLFAAGLAAFTHFSPAEIGVLAFGALAGCLAAFLVLAGVLADAGRTVDRLIAEPQGSGQGARAEDGAR